MIWQVLSFPSCFETWAQSDCWHPEMENIIWSRSSENIILSRSSQLLATTFLKSRNPFQLAHNYCLPSVRASPQEHAGMFASQSGPRGTNECPIRCAAAATTSGPLTNDKIALQQLLHHPHCLIHLFIFQNALKGREIHGMWPVQFCLPMCTSSRWGGQHKRS